MDQLKMAIHYIRQAQSKHRNNDFESAIVLYTKAINLLEGCSFFPNPKLYQALACRAYCSQQFDRHEDVISDCTRILEHDPDNMFILGMRGYSYIKKGDWLKANVDANTVLRLDSHSIFGLSLHGIISQETSPRRTSGVSWFSSDLVTRIYDSIQVIEKADDEFWGEVDGFIEVMNENSSNEYEVVNIGWPNYSNALQVQDGQILCNNRTAQGNFVVSVGKENIVRIWDLEKSRQVCELVGHQDYIYCGRFSIDGRFLITGGAKGSLRIWDIENHQCYLETADELGRSVTSVDFSPDGKSAVFIYDAYPEIYFINLSSKKIIKQELSLELDYEHSPFPPDIGACKKVCFPDNPDQIYVCYEYLDFSPTRQIKCVGLFDIKSGKIIKVVTDNQIRVDDFTVSTDGSKMLTRSYQLYGSSYYVGPDMDGPDMIEEILILWDTQTGEHEVLYESMQPHKLRDSYTFEKMAMSSDGQIALTARGAYLFCQWDLATKQVSLYQLPGRANNVLISPNDQYGIVGSDSAILSWKLKS